MAVRIGEGDFVYEVAEGWGSLPEGWGFKEVAAVGVDAKGRVYAFNRGGAPDDCLQSGGGVPEFLG